MAGIATAVAYPPQAPPVVFAYALDAGSSNDFNVTDSMTSENRVPKVGIGLPVYNGERYLREALDALLGQTFQDFELVICDNASDDATEQICRDYASRDRRIRYVRNQTNIGGPGNYRLAFESTRGEYFRWATCDDRCQPELLERCVAVLDNRPDVILAYPKTLLIGAHGEKLSEYDDGLHIQASTPSKRFIELTRNLRLANASYGVMRSNVLRKTNLIGSFIAADRLFLAELALHGKFFEVPERLFLRRMHPDAYSSSATVSKLMQWCDPKFRKDFVFTEWRHFGEYFRVGCRVPMSISERSRVLAHALRMGAWRRRKLGDELLQAARYYCRGLSMAPGRIGR